MIKYKITPGNGGTSINVNESVEGEYIEQKIERILAGNEPITDGAPIIYTERAEGVKPEYDVRTDRFEVALDAMDTISKNHVAKREERQKVNETQTGDSSTGGEATSTDGTKA